MAATRRLTAAVKAEVTADYNGLPHGRITEQDGDAHVFIVGLTELEAWLLALHGRITRQPAGPGVTLWTLHTTTDTHDGTPVHVHTLALDTEEADATITAAVA
ncbi:hypothetical protein [Streptomyces caniscabiei]|uniref:hypothetical protein n=1 Tax=Streptomyces caniscabiei TaxID=2746961 RepID=UPI0029AD93DF|nr:hypothetical protein [Streptomyces caniscabiei]MDX2986441.1 hypothetical protein [Streptomyces caniscabiei]